MKRSTLVIGASGALLAFVAVALAQQETPTPTQPGDTPYTTSRGSPPTAHSDYLAVCSAQLGLGQVPVDVHAEPRVNDLLREWKAAEDDAARGKVEDELRTALSESFEARLKAHEQQIQGLELQVKRLRDQLDLRREKQDDIVDFRLQQVLHEAQGLGWGADAFPSGRRAFVPLINNTNPFGRSRTPRSAR